MEDKEYLSMTPEELMKIDDPAVRRKIAEEIRKKNGESASSIAMVYAGPQQMDTSAFTGVYAAPANNSFAAFSLTSPNTAYPTNQQQRTSTSAVTPKKFCPECGTENKKMGKFCEECGTKLV